MQFHSKVVHPQLTASATAPTCTNPPTLYAMKLAAVLLALFAMIAAVLAQAGCTSCRSELCEHSGRVRHDVPECMERGGPSSTSQRPC